MELQNLRYVNTSNSFLFYHEAKSGQYNMKGCHFHNRYEIYYLVTGSRYYFIHDRTYLIQKGDLVFINPQVIHKTMDTGIPFHERCLIEFDPKFITNQETIQLESISHLFEANAILSLPLKGQLFVQELFRKMYQEISRQQLDYEVYLQSLLQQLLIYAGRSYNVDLVPKYSQINATHAKVSQIVQYMNQHFAEDLTLVSVSEKYEISHYYLSRLFKNITGFTFIEYLNGIRIKEAQRLLKETKLKVISIAHQVGFENQSHFGRTFKEFTNQSPLQFRKAYR